MLFVSIASYCDSELGPTISDLFAQAVCPDRIRVGVCLQSHPNSGDLDNIPPFPSEQVETFYLPLDRATGPCLARAIIQACAQELDPRPEYFLQIDSHTRFAYGWDESLVSLLSGRDDVLISGYPASYDLPANKIDPGYGAPQCPSDLPRRGRLGLPLSRLRRTALYCSSPCLLTCADKFDGNGFLRVRGRRCAPDSATLPGFFVAAGFLFGRFAAIMRAPYDAGLDYLFFGEEQSLSLRFWTAGVDICQPPSIILYHLWKRDHRPFFKDSFVDKALEDASKNSVHRLASGDSPAMLEASVKLVKVQRYVGLRRPTSSDPWIQLSLDCGLGLGTKRTVRDFERASGVNFQTRAISEEARNAWQHPSIFSPWESSLGCFVQGFVQSGFDGGIAGLQSTSMGADSGSDQEGVKKDGPVGLLGLRGQRNPMQALLGFLDPQTLEGAMVKTMAPVKTTPSESRRIKLGECPLLERTHCQSFNRKGYVIVDNFLTTRTVSGDASSIISATCEELKKIPKRKATVGNGTEAAVVRGDLLAWISNTVVPGLLPLKDSLIELSYALRASASAAEVDGPQERSLASSIRVSLMASHYPPGTRYVRHVDSANDAGRRITILWYANAGWQDTDGGCLRLYDVLPEDGDDEPCPAKRSNAGEAPFVDVVPVADRLVLFDSALVEHEVLPTLKDRYAVGGWIYW